MSDRLDLRDRDKLFALMRTDYRRLREPAVVYTALCVVLLMLVGTFFLDKSHATHRWIKFVPLGIQPSELANLTVILYLAWFLDLKRRNASAARRDEYRRDHEEIVAALRLRDADRATAAMRNHLAGVSGHLLGAG